MPYLTILSGKDGDFQIFSQYGRQVGNYRATGLLGFPQPEISRLDWRGGGGIRMEAFEGTK